MSPRIHSFLLRLRTMLFCVGMHPLRAQLRRWDPDLVMAEFL